ncbi:MAG: amidoligase family protein [Eubacterium sp.]|nr:amidoligase family protein [Eubacterium sp.]
MKQKIICTECSRTIDGDEITYIIHGETICEDCADGKTVVCDRCGERIWDSENEGDENITLCTSCYDRYYTTCEECGSVINTDDVTYDDDDRPYCDECYDENYRSIKNYSYKPEPIFYGTGDRFFGVELEMDKGGKSSNNADKILAAGNNFTEHIYIKSDGSLDSGMEIVTHPMTLDYHIDHMPWLEIMETAIRLGYCSHRTDTCGLHIHVGRNSLGDSRELQEERISRILYFVEHHWEELLKFSRRTEMQMNRWAARYGYKNNPSEMIEHAKKSGIGRHSCVNITNYDTIEFRLFRGTLKLNSLIAAIQLVDIICEMAITFNDFEIKSIGWTEFVESIDGCEYPELITYLKERRLYVNEPVESEEDV